MSSADNRKFVPRKVSAVIDIVENWYMSNKVFIATRRASNPCQNTPPGKVSIDDGFGYRFERVVFYAKFRVEFWGGVAAIDSRTETYL